MYIYTIFKKVTQSVDSQRLVHRFTGYIKQWQKEINSLLILGISGQLELE